MCRQSMSSNKKAGKKTTMAIRKAAAWIAAALLTLPVFCFGADDATGLWMGQIEISGVTYVHDPAADPSPVADPFDMAILMHRDADGQVRLLRQATLMKKTLKDSDGELIVNPVVITDDRLLAGYQGIVKRDGKLVGIRMGSLFFDFDPALTALDLDGDIGAGSRVSGELTLDETHPNNPFRHKYHPDHKKGFVVTRTFTLDFDAAPQSTAPPGEGAVTLGGVYQETLTGLHKAPMTVEGRFELRQLNQVPTLNDK